MKILVVEDDAETARYISAGLSELGHNVSVAADGREGLFQGSDHDWDLLLVDRMLPGLDGLVLVSTLRAAGVEAPVLFLTTLGGIDDRVNGLNAGADDYLVKPFAFSELAARVAALGRRPRKTQADTVLRVADLRMDLVARTVQRGGADVELQPREFRLLEVLMRHAGEVVTRTMLLEKVWDLHFDPQTNVVESHMSRLRAKLDVPAGATLIHTIRGAGYSIREPRP
ncbi:MAG: winged helix-turn-helix domain-containing protein [Stenotrophomonas sp.]|uniref:winged helix-turn-helix domain-containing protein n=1 Tax=Stenotrophomonas sp. TaxID=69392 RepID=UPI003D6C7AAA